MASTAVGTVSVKVKPDISGFTDDLRAALYALGARELLQHFLEWLDRNGRLEDGLRPAPELVEMFIEAQCAKAKERPTSPILDNFCDGDVVLDSGA